MSIERFAYYLHDECSSSERAEFIGEQLGMGEEEQDVLAEKIGRPFYEIKLDCTLDTETGAVQILGMQGRVLQ